MTEPEGFETKPERRREDKGASRSMLPALIALAALVTIGAALGLAVGLGGGEDGDGNAGVPSPSSSTSPNEIPQSLVEEVCLAGGDRAISTLSRLQEQGLLEALAERASRLGDPECADAVIEIDLAVEPVVTLSPPGAAASDYNSCIAVIGLSPELSSAVCQILFPARSR
jgi:hypothetical protein